GSSHMNLVVRLPLGLRRDRERTGSGRFARLRIENKGWGVIYRFARLAGGRRRGGAFETGEGGCYHEAGSGNDFRTELVEAGRGRRMAAIGEIQKELRDAGLDAWLFCDFHHRDPIAERVLGLGGGALGTRRWYYLIPKRGTPRKLVHRIEAGA